MSRFQIVDRPMIFPGASRVLKHYKENNGPYIDTSAEDNNGRLYISYEELVHITRAVLKKVPVEKFLSDIQVETPQEKVIKQFDLSVLQIAELEARVKDAILESVSDIDVLVNVVFDNDDRPDSNEVPKDSTGESEGDSSSESGPFGVSKEIDTDISF